MKPILILALFFGIATACYCYESRLSDPLFAINSRVEPPLLSTEVEPGTTRPSLVSRWYACLSGDYPSQKSMSVNYGLSYDPNDNNDFLLLSFQWKWKYRDVWMNNASDALFFRLEAAGGLRLKTEERGVFSCGMFAQRYLESLSTARIRPYVDGGIGVIYTDFQNHNQGLRVNFNPRLSVGADFITRSGSTWFMAFRLFHLSNAGLHEDNRGINVAMIVIGRNF